jgi:flagellar M-ring protein FliF
VEVTVDVVTERESITERRFDPEGRVAIATDTEELTTSSTEPQGQVTVASNLPEGDAAEGAAGRSQSNETRERVNFEVSETQCEVLRAPGAIRRLSVAVLVDGVAAPGPDGATVLQPRPQEELDVLRELVASAVGFDEARGDVITLRSLVFEPRAVEGTLAEAGLLAGLDLMSLIQIAVLALVALVLGLFVLRPLLLSSRPPVPAPLPELPPPAPLPPLPLAGGADPFAGPRILTGEIDDRQEFPAIPIVSDDDDPLPSPNDPVARLRRLIEERQAESVEILRGWMEEREEKA